MRRGRKIGFRLLALVLCIVTVFCYVRSLPLLHRLGIIRINNDAAGAINRAVGDVIENNGITYADIVHIEKDAAGNLTALRTDVAVLNLLREQTLSCVDSYFEELRYTKYGIPLGSILFPSFFSGTGPTIPLKLTSANTSSAVYSSRFSDAGINQTRHEIVMRVAVNMTVLAGFGTREFETEYEVVVADTVILGAVPQTLIEQKR